MAGYKFDGKEFRDRRGSRIGEIDSKYIRAANRNIFKIMS